ncbi:Arm DNA-binding domain-containing protein [Priestia flexa]|uniref:Arm DNA-binding domain-containing protein n=1 Tax=Priestia flexa TaxID=86664 RepID=UPI0026C1466C|nr:Arm DNA-binding domain-containing protein [Priestia flexa]MEC0667262.1 Arm DNA-binding domain-containing protein [Priestia flexa]
MRGSVKKDDKSWYYVIDIGTNGKRKKKKQRNFRTKKEVEKALAEINYALSRGTYIES